MLMSRPADGAHSPRVANTLAVLTVLAPTAMFFSPAAFSIILAAALAAMLWARAPLRIPPASRAPLALFVLGTLVASALSPHPAGCWPQIKKLWLFFAFAAVYSAVRRRSALSRIALLWAGLSGVAAIWSVVQFVQKWNAARLAHADFYLSYIGYRVTGFRDHWMTFAGEQMIALLTVLSLLLFGPRVCRRWWVSAVVAGCMVSIAISMTRGVWIATIVGILYLLAAWRPKAVALVPVAVIVVLAVGPQALRDRVVSLYRPHGEVDSNSHRVYVWSTGVEMVRAHPWFGIGPDQVAVQFDRYVPSSLPKKRPEGFYGHLHNIYLQYAAERGVPTLLALLAFVLGSGYVFARALRNGALRSQSARFSLHAAIAVTLGVLVEGFTENNLADSEILAMYLAVMAMGYIAAETGHLRRAEASQNK